MMKTKRMLSLAMAGVLSIGTLTTAGCGKEKIEGNNALEIYLCELGNGRDWLDNALAAFAEKQYVKDKYPNFQYDVSADSEYTKGQAEVLSGTTTFDLLFASTFSPQTVETQGKDGKPSILEEITDVYNGKIPDFNGGYEKNADGEEWTFAEKMRKEDPNRFNSLGFKDNEGETHYYYTTAGSNLYGILYNKTKLIEYGYLTEDADGNVQGLPRTTDELKAFAEKIKNGGRTPFVAAKDTGYWTRVQNLWWAQYEGAEAYDRYFQGMYENDEGEWKRDVEVLSKTQGRLLANQVTESLLWYDNGLIHKDSAIFNFTQAQTKLLLGEGLMQANGTWFDTEMKEIAAEAGNNTEIRLMTTPMLSDIIKVVPDKSIDDDKELSSVVAALESGATSLEGVTQKDFDRVKEAYSIYNLGEAFSPVLIPSYSDATELAKDFVRFLATDEFARIFMQATGGSSSSFYYDVETADPALYNSFSAMQKDRIKIMKGKSSILQYKTSNYPIVYRTSYSDFGKGYELYYMLAAKNDRKHAADLIAAQIEDYTRNDNQKWNMLLTQAGLK